MSEKSNSSKGDFSSAQPTHYGGDAAPGDDRVANGVSANFESSHDFAIRVVTGRCTIAQVHSRSWKTVKFAVGCLAEVKPELHACQIIIVAPTRELAKHFHSTVAALGAFMNVACIACVGGTSDSRQELQILRRGAHIAVGTPGGIRDVIRRRTLRTDKIERLIVGRANEMRSGPSQEQMDEILAILPETVRSQTAGANARPVRRLPGGSYLRDQEKENGTRSVSWNSSDMETIAPSLKMQWSSSFSWADEADDDSDEENRTPSNLYLRDQKRGRPTMSVGKNNSDAGTKPTQKKQWLSGFSWADDSDDDSEEENRTPSQLYLRGQKREQTTMSISKNNSTERTKSTQKKQWLSGFSWADVSDDDSDDENWMPSPLSHTSIGSIKAADLPSGPPAGSPRIKAVKFAPHAEMRLIPSRQDQRAQEEGEKRCVMFVERNSRTVSI